LGGRPAFTESIIKAEFTSLDRCIFAAGEPPSD